MNIHNHSCKQESMILASSCPKKRGGRKKFKETRHPVYRGVRRRNNNRWVCELRAPNNRKPRIWLGTYPTPEMAARAHNVAALALRGNLACLNFADSATGLHIPASGDVRDIQRAAAEAAEAFGMGRKPEECEELIEERSGVGFMDEEATFYMPKLLIHMAEGMLMSPPRHGMYEGGFGWDEMEGESEVSLWSYSI